MNRSLVSRVQAGETLTRAEADALMEELLSGAIATPEIVRMLRAMNARPYEVEEVVGFALAMRRNAARVFADGERLAGLVDTCGTGGGYSRAFNISTAAAIVAAAAGARVAKHGNRSSTSLCGSADVLEALGVRVDLPIERAGQAIREIGIGFLFARTAHSSMRHVIPARREIGGRTVFNLLGPMTNPAGAESQVVGVFAIEVIDLMAQALAKLGVRRAFVVHGADGLGEISLSGETFVAEVRDGAVKRFTVTPEEFGVARSPLEAVSGGASREENAAMIRGVLAGENGPRRDVVVMNAAAALVASGATQDFLAAVRLAGEAIASGAARKKLATLVAFTAA
ncbi:MAG TPA: anthranilate phosphoribosyltransferase [Candidatus Acidoferrum sp.]